MSIVEEIKQDEMIYRAKLFKIVIEKWVKVSGILNAYRQDKENVLIGGSDHFQEIRFGNKTTAPSIWKRKREDWGNGRGYEDFYVHLTQNGADIRTPQNSNKLSEYCNTKGGLQPTDTNQFDSFEYSTMGGCLTNSEFWAAIETFNATFDAFLPALRQLNAECIAKSRALDAQQKAWAEI